MADYLEVSEARARRGMRLALTAGFPGPWGEAAKAIFRHKSIPFAMVRQNLADPNDELFAWTGHRNAPVAVYDDERPRLARLPRRVAGQARWGTIRHTHRWEWASTWPTA